jgi:hypothetical protein
MTGSWVQTCPDFRSKNRPNTVQKLDKYMNPCYNMYKNRMKVGQKSTRPIPRVVGK